VVWVTAENWVAVTQEFFQRAFRGEVHEAMELLDPEVSYQVPGTRPPAGVYEGAQAVAQHLTDLLRFTDHTVNVLQWEDWLVGVNHLAALVHIRVQRHHAIHTFRAVSLVTMTESDKIRQIEMFFSDPAEMERFFAW
jgi:ketosteroid isomerase-like protein